jgi:EH domain-containing protein 1
VDHEMNEKELQKQLQTKVKRKLEPLFGRYNMDFGGIDASLKWKPIVLIIGNYSSGKSTLINELVGQNVQRTGQAPTDDSFTIITYDDSADDTEEIQVTQERDGKFLLNDPDYPFEILKKHGQRFAAHFRLKKVNSPFLKTGKDAGWFPSIGGRKPTQLGVFLLLLLFLSTNKSKSSI